MIINFPTAKRKFDVLVVGRAGMDLYPQPDGSKINSAQLFQSDMGGSAGNSAVALARHGLRVALWSAFSKDPVGDFARRSLTSYSVDTSYCFEAPEGTRTTLALVENLLDGFETVIYRNNAADFSIRPEQISDAMLNDCRCLLVSGTCLAQEPSRSAIFRTLELAATVSCPVVLDIDYRPYSWGSADEQQQVYQDAARACAVIVGNDEEFAVMAGSMAGGVDLAQALARDSGKTCIYKMGAKGSITYQGGEQLRTGIYPVQTRKPVGAGDAFMGSMLAALMQGIDLAQALRRGSAAAAMVVSAFGCASAMPDSAALEKFMASKQELIPDALFP